MSLESLVAMFPSSTSVLSQGPLFQGPIILSSMSTLQWPYAPKVLCSEGPRFPTSTYILSSGPMLTRSDVTHGLYSLVLHLYSPMVPQFYICPRQWPYRVL